jgi:SAM-dependent methyltransferase
MSPQLSMSSAPPNHDASNLLVYDHARLYDVAFSERDFTAEVSSMIRWATALLGHPPTSALELCAGPADHAIAAARAGLFSTALDLSSTMCTYASAKAAAEGQRIDVLAADMRDFTLAAPVDLAFTMLNSISHLHTLEDLIAHFRTVGRNLAEGGVYVLEVQHPKDFVGRASRGTAVSLPWTVARDEIVVETTWGHVDSPYDSVRQIFAADVTLRARFGDQVVEQHEIVRMRDWTFDEMRAAAMLSGALTLARAYGDFDDAVTLDGSEKSWRMILVFARAV